LPGVLLVGEGSGCLGSVFVFLDTVRCRRTLLREGDYGLPCGRVPINDQSEYKTGMNGLLTFVFLAPSLAAQLSGCFVLAPY
jgi:hypothetical protein